MYKHHEDSIKNLIDMYKDNTEVLAVILGGSIAKGKERIDSDIDATIIVSEDMYRKLSQENKLSVCIFGHCTYENGYFDLKHFTKNYILQAAKTGSEPTRNAFIGARCILSKDSEIVDIIKKIPVYPQWEKEEKILSFYSAFNLSSGFFWSEAQKAKDTYLIIRTAADIVLFGMRMLLAYNEKLFPCQKWLMRAVSEIEKKPENIIEKANDFLHKLDEKSKEDFVNSILSFGNWNIPDDFSKTLTRYVEDNEQWWYNSQPNIAEW